MEFLPAGLAGNDFDGGFQVFGAALDVRIAGSTPGLAVVFVIHGPAIEAIAGELVHDGPLALARNVEIETPRGDRGTMHEKQHRLRRLPRLRRAGALTEHPQR